MIFLKLTKIPTKVILSSSKKKNDTGSFRYKDAIVILGHIDQFQVVANFEKTKQVKEIKFDSQNQIVSRRESSSDQKKKKEAENGMADAYNRVNLFEISEMEKENVRNPEESKQSLAVPQRSQLINESQV